ncbi:unnamed protein product [Pieris macdunnoughi]|uniref:PHD-type domain-containing protein n=1 Tax=Pieris macdunnoughi TaxID=345717 RepID=A0A821W3W3_9NEOP|nr:unnamed protein product [Pieris macdunnoughi]
MADHRKCNACLKSVANTPSLNCSRCKAEYHHFCINYSLPEYNAMSVELKSKWICLQCQSRERKGGDNSNTPVRSNNSVALESPHLEFVTQRTKARTEKNCSCISPSSIRDIIREEFELLFTHKIHPEMLEVRNAVSSLEASMTYFNAELEKVKADQAEQTKIIGVLKSETESLRATNISLSSRLAQMDQHVRSSNVEIQCVPENKQENLINTVMQLGKVIKCPISETQIHYCSRLAKINNSSPRPRSILVKFNSPRLRDEFLAATSKFNKINREDKLNTSHLGIGANKKAAIYVAEHLTHENKRLHATARSKAKELGYKFVWVRDARIYMRKDEQSSYIYVKDIDLVNKLS